MDPEAGAWHGRHAAVRVVLHFGLRHHDGQLSFQRHELLVAEQILRAETGAVDDDRLAKRRELARRIEFADHNLAAPQLKVTDEIVEVDRRLDADLRRADRVLRGERMLARLQHLASDVERRLQIRALGIRRLPLRQVVDERVVVEP